MITTKETGVQYINGLTLDVINFHKDNNLTFAYVTRPLTTIDPGGAFGITKTYVDDITPEEIESGYEKVRAFFYATTSDPLFFKYQRGEVEKQIWLDSVATIKTTWSYTSPS